MCLKWAISIRKEIAIFYEGMHCIQVPEIELVPDDEAFCEIGGRIR